MDGQQRLPWERRGQGALNMLVGALRRLQTRALTQAESVPVTVQTSVKGFTAE